MRPLWSETIVCAARAGSRKRVVPCHTTQVSLDFRSGSVTLYKNGQLLLTVTGVFKPSDEVTGRRARTRRVWMHGQHKKGK